MYFVCTFIEPSFKIMFYPLSLSMNYQPFGKPLAEKLEYLEPLISPKSWVLRKIHPYRRYPYKRYWVYLISDSQVIRDTLVNLVKKINRLTGNKRHTGKMWKKTVNNTGALITDLQESFEEKNFTTQRNQLQTHSNLSEKLNHTGFKLIDSHVISGERSNSK